MKSPDRPTSGGVELTDELIERLAAEAEQGYDPADLRPRPRRGRPPMGAAAATVFQVRLEPELHAAVVDAARRAGVSPSELTRQALRAYLGEGEVPERSGAVPTATETGVELALLGADLNRLRETRRMTVRDLSDSAGRSISTVYSALSGRTRPTWAVLQEIVTALGEDPAEWRARWERLPSARGTRIRSVEYGKSRAASWRGVSASVERRFAVIVGVDGEGLRSAERDARAMRDVLCDPEIGTFDPDDVALFAGPRTSADDVTAAVRRFAADANRSDQLLLYFAGHGAISTGGRDGLSRLSTYGRERPDGDSCVDFLNREVAGSFAGTTMLILDCCFSGGVTTAMGRYSRRSRLSVLAAACTSSGTSTEGPEIQHGVFTGHLLRALQGKAGNDGPVTLAALGEHVLRQDIEPRPGVILRSQGDLVLTRPHVASSGPWRSRLFFEAGSGKTASWADLLARHSQELTHLFGRLSQVARKPYSSVSPPSSPPVLADSPYTHQSLRLA